jgi:hypothetical protein
MAQNIAPFSNELDRRAYREAGHACMSFLIRHGYILQYLPRDLSLVLNEFTSLSLDGPAVDWDKLTFSLGSLMSVPQVLLAGYLAERRQFELQRLNEYDLTSPLAKKSLHLITSYVEEYGGEEMSFKLRDEKALEIFKLVFAYVAQNLETFWPSVQALAAALLDRRTLSQAQAFEIILRAIPAGAQLQAREYMARTQRKGA